MKTHKTEIRVRYEETDRMGVAYYGNYFTWFEVARSEHFRKLGLPYTELEEKGLRLMVADTKCAYKTPVTYDDLIDVETEITNMKNTSFVFLYKIYHKRCLVATGESTHVFTDVKGKPVRIPEKIKVALSVSV